MIILTGLLDFNINKYEKILIIKFYNLSFIYGINLGKYSNTTICLTRHKSIHIIVKYSNFDWPRCIF